MTQTAETGYRDGPFVDRCHYSKTGFAIWRWNSSGISYCTCREAPRPDGWKDEGDANAE